MAHANAAMTPARHRVLEEDLRTLFSAALPWERLQGRSVLITGAAGLVAAYLVEALLYLNETASGVPCKVVALVRDGERAAIRFAHHESRSDLQFLVQDVADPVPFDIKADFIIHAAGHATPRSFGMDPVGTYRSAVLGTHYLLEHAHRVGSEGFLLLSSGAVHGTVAGVDTIIDERVIGTVDPLDPYACYAESKRMAETICASWTRQFGVSTRIARLGHTYGPGLRRDDDRAFAQFVYSVVDRRDIVLHTDGDAVRPYCYLSDAADALFRILLTGMDGEAYLLANAAASCSIRDLAILVSRLFPERGVSVRSDDLAGRGSVANRDPLRQLDTSKLFTLGWSPKIEVKRGFRRTLETLI
jgi:nucleoside-diphosphate-sugar epimerase